MVARYRHYKNLVKEGETGFFTTTCLDFNHAMARPEPKRIVCATLCDDCIFYGGALHGFVVMSNHFHFIAKMPPQMDGCAFMQKLKEHTAKAILPVLSAAEQSGFDQQRGLNNRKFWQRGFDSVPIEAKAIFLQKLEYIHSNPVKAGLCSAVEDYLWSSARFFADGKWDEAIGLAEVALPLFQNPQHDAC
jgi:putative transposase